MVTGRMHEEKSEGSRGRRVIRVAHSVEASEGAGVRLRRVIGTPALPDLDPFLLLDEFRSDRPGDYLAGFPDHPHRGFETVTYMLAGRMRHHDNQGNSGLLEPGGVQWMTAGRGIVHSEMPEQQDGLLHGFQLWVNLPAKDKMSSPRYQDISPDAVPTVEADEGASVKVIAGSFGGVEGPVTGIVTRPVYLDVAVPESGRFVHALPSGHTAFMYVYEGEVAVGDEERTVGRGEIAALSKGEMLEVAAAKPARFLLAAGQPLGEPVAKYGPFVMNTPEQIHEAIADFRAGRL